MGENRPVSILPVINRLIACLPKKKKKERGVLSMCLVVIRDQSCHMIMIAPNE